MKTPAAIVDDAMNASAEAAFAALDSLGGDRGDCGSAWVVLRSRKGRKALVEALKARTLDTSPHHTGGVAVRILRNLNCQSRLPYEKGCDAFARVLRDAGFDAGIHSYAD